MKKLGLHFQTIGVAELNHENMFDSLKQLAKMGYQGVEFAGFMGWSPKELRKMLDDLGLVCIGCHYKDSDFAGVADVTAWSIETAKTLGMKTVCLTGFGIPAGEYSGQRIDSMKDGMNAFVKECAAAGLRTYFHTSLDYFDLNDKGQTFADQIMENVPGLDVEVDTIWCMLGGKDPVEYVRSYKGRQTLLHYKDLTQEIYDTCNIHAPGTLAERYSHAIRYADTPSGTGIQDGPGLIRASRECGITDVIIEQMGNANEVTREKSLEIARQAFEAVDALLTEEAGV